MEKTYTVKLTCDFGRNEEDKLVSNYERFSKGNIPRESYIYQETDIKNYKRELLMHAEVAMYKYQKDLITAFVYEDDKLLEAYIIPFYTGEKAGIRRFTEEDIQELINNKQKGR